MFPAHRRLSAGLVVLLAGLAAAVLPSPARAADGTYAHMLCSNPDTQKGVAQDGQMPAGVTTSFGHGNQVQSVAQTRCGKDRTITGNDGMLLTVDSGYTTSTAFWGPFLRYKAPTGVSFEGAKLYRRGWTGNSWAWSIVAADSSDHTSAPRWDDCWRNYGCTSRGSAGLPFDPATNLRNVAATTTGGFTLKLACHIPASPGYSCTADGSGVRIYGAKVQLRDSAPPTIVATPAGELADDATLAGPAEFSVGASDAGAGVYRVIVRVDGTDRLTQIAGSNGGKCADVNPDGNADPYEFALAQPCAPSTDGLYTFDTAQLPDGEHRLVVQVEDAGGNRATAVNRQVTIDNIPAPTAVSAPTISGPPLRSNQLAVTPAVFDDHGAPGDVAVTRAWLRCKADGTGCAAISGITGTAYTLGNDDLNRVIKVVETATNSEGQAVSESVATARITREDGTLPPDNDGQDNDGDGVVDEPGETSPGPSAPGTGGSGVGATGLPGRDGANGANARSVTTVVNNLGPVNGEGASTRATLTVAFTKGGAKGKVAYGKHAVAKGRLVDESGRPIRSAIIDVAETPTLRGAKAAAGRPSVTDGDGAFSYTASSKAGTRTVTFSYRYQRQGPVVAQAGLALSVKAGVQLKVRLKGIVATYSGRVLAGSIPKGGKLVIVQGRAKGGSWQTFASRRAGKNGAFKGKYRLKVRRPGKKLQFRVRVLSEAGWNFSAVTSKAVTRTVR